MDVLPAHPGYIKSMTRNHYTFYVPILSQITPKKKGWVLMPRKKMKLPNGYGTVFRIDKRKRRRPFVVKKTIGWDLIGDKAVQNVIVIGYAKTYEEGIKMLEEYNLSPYDVSERKTTFSQVWERWSEEHFPELSDSTIAGYKACYKTCSKIYNIPMSKLRTKDLQRVIDESGKNAPTLKRFKSLLHSMYKYALRYDIVDKDYSRLINVQKHKNKNPNQRGHTIFTNEEIKKLWANQFDADVQVVLMLIYTGVRIGEMLNIKKEDVHLNDRYIEIHGTKTENAERIVPIAEKIYPFVYARMKEDGEYLINNTLSTRAKIDNYRRTRWTPVMKNLDMNHTPHDTRHTCASLLANADTNPLVTKKILGHSGAMDLTEKVYTHLDVSILIDAINKI